MAAKLLACTALVASAAAFAPATGALRTVRTGASSLSMISDATKANGGRAPIITIFDHRGCSRHANKEYTGKLLGTQDDEMCVKVGTAKLAYDKDMADAVLSASLNTLQK